MDQLLGFYRDLEGSINIVRPMPFRWKRDRYWSMDYGEMAQPRCCDRPEVQCCHVNRQNGIETGAVKMRLPNRNIEISHSHS